MVEALGNRVLSNNINDAVEVINIVSQQLDDLINESSVTTYTQHYFPGTANNDSPSSDSYAESAIFYPITIRGYNYIKLGAVISGYGKLRGHVNSVPISGLELKRASSGTDMLEGEWVNIDNGETEISLYLASEQISWTFDAVESDMALTTSSGVTAEISGGILTLSDATAPGQGEYLSTDETFSYGDIQTSATFGFPNSTLYCGLIWDYDDSSNFKYLIMNTNGIYLGDCISGSFTNRDTYATGLTYNTYYELKISVSSAGSVVGYLDGTARVDYDWAYTPTDKTFGLLYYYAGSLTNRTVSFEDLILGGSSTIYSPYILGKQ